jgi:hypothetical protein
MVNFALKKDGGLTFFNEFSLNFYRSDSLKFYENDGFSLTHILFNFTRTEKNVILRVLSIVV